MDDLFFLLLPHLFTLLCGVDVSYETPPFNQELSFLPRLFNHLRFGIPLILFPGTSFTITILPTYSSSLLNTCPCHFNLLSCTFLDMSPALTVPPIISFLILSSLVTHSSIFLTTSCPPHPTSSLALSSVPSSRHRTSLFILLQRCISNIDRQVSHNVRTNYNVLLEWPRIAALLYNPSCRLENGYCDSFRAWFKVKRGAKTTTVSFKVTK